MAGRDALPLVLALLLALPVMLPAGPAWASTEDRAGDDLVVSSERSVAGDERYDHVLVTGTGSLTVEQGGTLTARAIDLEDGSRLAVRGGTLVVMGNGTSGTPGLRGVCSQMAFTEGAVVLFQGEPGTDALEASHGASVLFQVRARGRIVISDSQVILEGGAGWSPGTSATDGDLEGGEHAGGSVLVALSVDPGGTLLRVFRSSIAVRGGDGGDAPDGGPPIVGHGGPGGGFTSGGNVSGTVGSGGGVGLELAGPRVELDESTVGLVGGNGGDAGDGASGGDGPGGGGGGYSGGGGAADGSGATDGGRVSGDVGRGGPASMRVDALSLYMNGSLVSLGGGDGGSAGRGGDGGSRGGGGGGGYSGGGGGCHPDGAGGAGGDVSGAVGMGGDATLALNASHQADVLGCVVQVEGGAGGDAGDGGDCDLVGPSEVLGGAGGGGYTGGGGGGAGPVDPPGPGNDGGAGGDVSDSVGAGGHARLAVSSAESRLLDTSLEAAGGPGGGGGSAGTGTRGDSLTRWYAGGGGGSYTAGGGAGTVFGSWSSGAGGMAGAVAGMVGDGGNCSLLLLGANATIPATTVIGTTAGPGGNCWRSPALGGAGGKAAGRPTQRGGSEELVPVSRGILLSPEDGGMGSAIPNFRWDAIHPSTTHGDVVGYELQLDDDDNFRSPETSVTVSCTEFLPNWLPGLTFHWRVRPIYSRPWEHRGAWSPGRTFHYVNLPPEVQPIPDMDLPVGKVVTVDLSPFLHDPDDGNEKLTLRAVDEYVLRVDRLGLVFFFQDEVETHLVRFTVGDWMSEVEGELTVHALRYRHPPYIIGLSDQRPPLKVYVDEGSTETYLIRVHDVDSTEFIYRCTGWDGAVAKPDGTVEFRAEHGEVGQFRATIEVEDEGGRTASMDVDIVVENVNDPPDAPIVLSPAYGAVYDPGQIITFRAMVHDDDVDLGQVLKVSFISNVSGVLRTIVTEGAAEFTLADLPPGRHLITVVVTDGRYSASSETVLDVTGTPAPPPVTTRTDEGVDPVLVLLAAASLFTAGYGGGRWQRKRRPGGG